MGVYDIVCGVQIKCTSNPTLKEYKKGDKIDLFDGLYVGYEGWFRVKKGKIIDNGTEIFDKWGTVLDLEKTLINNPIF